MTDQQAMEKKPTKNLRDAPKALWVGLITFFLGGQFVAIAQIRLYNQPWLQWIYNNPPMMIIAFIARFGWIALAAGLLTWTRPWQEVRALAAIDGAGDLLTARRVIWPMAWPLCAAAAQVVMVLSLREVPMTTLLAPQRPPMFVPMLMTWVHKLRDDDMIEGSLLLMITVLLIATIAVALLYWFARDRSRPGPTASTRQA